MSIRSINGVIRRLNWKRQPKSLRDWHLMREGAGLLMTAVLPKVATTRTIAAPAIRDQGQLGSCVAHGSSEAMAFVYMQKNKLPDPMFSPLFGYYYTRLLEGTPETEDSGCNVRDVFDAYSKYGLCLESTWPYDISKFSDAPNAAAVAEALNHKAITYYACNTIQAIKQSIADGWPVIFGFDCYTSLESEAVANTGYIPMPAATEDSIGGHCMVIDSYDDVADTFGGQNSWGEGWGNKGYFTMPQAYFREGLASDATTLRVEEMPTTP